MKKIFLLSVCTMLLSSIVVAQEKGVQIQDIERIPLGDGTYTYRYSKGEKKHLEGRRRIVLGRNEYFEADFSNGQMTGDYELFAYNTLVEKKHYNDKGHLDGKQITYYRDGSIEREAHFKDGKIDGRIVHYHSNGQIKEEQEFKDGVENGIQKAYDSSGNIISDCYYKNGKPHGKQVKRYSDRNGFETNVSEYDNGKPVGRFTRTLASGVVTHEGQYDENGEKTGIWIIRTKDGTPKSETPYKHDKEEGFVKTFYNDGKIKEEKEYKDGKETGLVKKYDFRTGNLISETNRTTNNVLEGEQTLSFTSNLHGRYTEHGTYVKGVKDGRFIETYENGKKKSEGVYVNGKKDGKWMTYFRDGKPESEITYKNDEYDGEVRLYTRRGISSATMYKNGKKHGLHRKYNYETGKLLEEEHYTDGVVNGICRRYHENGKIYEEYTAVNGEPDGPYKRYDHNGKLVKEGVFKNGRMESSTGNQ